MKFAFRPVRICEGMLLGHSVALGSNRLRKGRWLTTQDIQNLQQANISEIFAGEREPGDVLENDAAQALAEQVSGARITRESAQTGRCNLVAQSDGLLTYDRSALIALNLTDPRLTLAMLPPLSPVRSGDLVGTVKIIPFAVPEAALQACIAAWPESKDIAIAPFRAAHAHLLETRLPSVKPLSPKIIGHTEARVQRVGFELCRHDACDHATFAVSSWLSKTAAKASQDDVLLIFGASATVDKADVIPHAIEHAGGVVERVGMAVDPGNLLVFGSVKGLCVIGLPGCAKSPALNGFDWVLERVAAGVEISARDWAEFSVGGLLKEIEARPHPRRPAVEKS